MNVKQVKKKFKQQEVTMNVKKGKKKLSSKKLTIWNLDSSQDVVLSKDEQRVIKTGSDDTIPAGVGVTLHPKYC
jgi:hypothetical protein